VSVNIQSILNYVREISKAAMNCSRDGTRVDFFTDR